MPNPLDEAREIGREHGVNAAGWWEQDAIGGRARAGTELETARRTLAAISDCDWSPYDHGIGPDLSGEWADGYLPQDLETACLNDQYGLILTWIYGHQPDTGELCDAYEEGFNTAVVDAIVTSCRSLVEHAEATSSDRAADEDRAGGRNTITRKADGDLAG